MQHDGTKKPRGTPVNAAAATTAHHAIDLDGLTAGDYVTVGGHWCGLTSAESQGTADFSPHPKPPASARGPECGTAERRATYLNLKLMHCPWLGCPAEVEIESPLRERAAQVATWVRERIAEDRALAVAATPGPWEFEGDDLSGDEIYSIHDGEHGDRVGDIVAYTRGCRDGEQLANGIHAARHHPDRILRQFDALTDALADLEKLADQAEHPDARALARDVIMSLAGIWADADEISATYLGSTE